MSYAYPALWNACVAHGWANTQYVSPQEWNNIVIYAECYHKGKGKVDSYVRKALKKAGAGHWSGSTLLPLQMRLTAIVDQKRTQETQLREQRVAEAARVAAQQREMEITKLRQELAATQQQLVQANSHFEQNQATLNSVRSDMVRLNAKIEEERDAKRVLEVKVDTLATSLANAQGDIQVLAREFGEARKQVRDLDAQLGMALNSLMQAQRKIDDLLTVQQSQQRTVDSLRQNQIATNTLLTTLLDAALNKS